ncbi:MAG: HEAT repeat domain-containing protein [bacterium]|nr:HEAT repeat domain-containing protein [bacterium]
MSTPTGKRSSRRLVVAITLMVLVWVAVLVGRNQIRARWWEYRLTRTPTADAAQDRAGYVARLASLGPAALSSAQRLAAHEDPNLRILGVTLAEQIDHPRSVDLLTEAATDPDPEIRTAAVLGLRRHRAVPPLADLARGCDAIAACAAVDALAAIGTTEAIDVVTALAAPGADNRAELAVRIQAIESLGLAGIKSAVPVLKSCLDDNTVFEGRTLAERSAAAAIEAHHPGSRMTLPGPRTVAGFATRALEAISGESWAAGPALGGDE